MELGTGAEKCDIAFLSAGIHYLVKPIRNWGSDRERVRVALDAKVAELHRYLSLWGERDESKMLPLVWIPTYSIIHATWRGNDDMRQHCVEEDVAYVNNLTRNIVESFGMPILSFWEMTRTLERDDYLDGYHVRQTIGTKLASVLLEYLMK